MASSSESDSGEHYLLHSSPLCAQDYGSNDEFEESSIDDEPFSSSPENSSAQSSPCSKRRRYRLYREDPSVSVPRETVRRWNLSSLNPNLATSNSGTQGVESRLHSEGGAGSFQENESGTTTESEGKSSESEDDLGNSGHNSDALSHSSESLTVQDWPNNAVSCSNDSESDVSDDSDTDNELLFTGSSKTTDEAVLDICNLFLKHRLTKASLNDTLKVMAATLPTPNNMPKSLYDLCKYINSSPAACPEKCYFFCSKCLEIKLAKTDVCGHCNGSQSGVFYYFSIRKQIEYLFESDRLVEAIDDYQNARSIGVGTGTAICDILDGSEYKRVKNHATGKYDLILEWNSDGISLSDSSDVKFYPLMSTICEVAPKLRPYYIMVNAIWIDASAPRMSTFLKPFAVELREISDTGGVEWSHPKTGDKIKSQVYAPLFIGDAPLRADVVEIMRYNAIYGCGECEQKAVQLPPRDGRGRSLRRFVFAENPATQRTAERMHIQGEKAKSMNKKHVKGVKGKSIVDDIPLLDKAKCTLAEYMHSVLLGVTCYFATMWFSKPGPWYIGNRKTEVDDFLTSIKVLDHMRDARKISKMAYFKASEFRSWLLFYSLIVLQTVNFPEEYYQHWILLVKSVYILLQDTISESDLLAVEIMLRSFLRDIHTLYLDYDYLYNVHQLSHLTAYVRRWGPLSVTSAFMFENYNGVLARMVHGTKHQGKELTENLKLARCIHILDLKVKNSASTNDCGSKASVHGKAGKITITSQDLEILRDAGIAEFEMYRRASFKGVVYTSRDYDLNKKKCNSLIEFHVGDKKCRGKIIGFVRKTENIVCYVEKFKVRQSDLIFHRESMQKITHLLPVDESNERIIVEFPSIICKVLKVGQYIASSPNKVETHL